MRRGVGAIRFWVFGRGPWRLAGLAAWGLLGVLVMGMAVQAQGTGVFEGRVVNGTPGGPEVGAGITVALHILRGDAELDVLQTVTDADGTFGFEGLDTSADLEYWPEVVYLDIPYSPDESYRFENGTLPEATLTVFETTDDDSGVRLSNVHLIAESFEQVLRVSEIHFFGNSADQTFVGTGEGSEQATVFIPLPPNAVGLSYGEGETEGRLVEVDGGVQDTEPVPPGTDTSLVFFSYHLMVPGETVPLERVFAYPVDSLSLLVAQPGLELRSDQLVSMGPEIFQGQQYEFFVAQNLDAGTPLKIELLPVAGASGGSGMPAAPSEAGTATTGAGTRGNQSVLLWLGLGLAGLAVVGAVVFPLVTGGSAQTPTPTPNLSASPEAREMVVELADLEDAFEAGQVDEAAYERRRAELFDELKAL